MNFHHARAPLAILLAALFCFAGAAHAQFTTAPYLTGVEITGYTGSGGDVVIPLQIGGLNVLKIGDSAFAGQSSITSITLPYRLTTIGTGAFSKCRGISSVFIPANVTSIGAGAFSSCDRLVSILVDTSNVTYASSPDGVLFDSSPLPTTLIQYPSGKLGSSYTIPVTVTTIAAEAFEGNMNLVAIELPTAVTTVGLQAFAQSLRLIRVTLGIGVATIGNNAFDGIATLRSATFLGNAPGTFGTDVFRFAATGFEVRFVQGATGFTSPTWTPTPGQTYNSRIALVGPLGDFYYQIVGGGVEILGATAAAPAALNVPSTLAGLPVRSIADGAFAGSSTTTSVTLPDSLTTIGTNAFYGCTGLTMVAIPGGVTSIGTGAFAACTGLTAITVAAANPNYSAVGGVLFDITRTVLVQYPCALAGTSYTIPATVTTIGDKAFEENILSTVVIPDTVTTIGTRAFYNSQNLVSITLGIGVTSMGNEAFASGVGSLNSAAFMGNAPTTFGTNVFTGAAAGFQVLYFASATGFTTPTWTPTPGQTYNTQISNLSGNLRFSIAGGEVTITGYAGPVGPGGLVAIPTTIGGLPVRQIAASAFANMAAITAVTLPPSLTMIGTNAFYGCDGLTTVAIPAGVTSIGTGAFAACTGLTTITVDAANTNYSAVGGVLFNKNQTTLVQYPCNLAGTSYAIPATVTTIGAQAFEESRNLATVTIPDTVQVIGVRAFYNSPNLVSVTFGTGVTSIGNEAFASGVGSLNFAAFLGNAPATIGTNVFQGAATGFFVRHFPGASGFTTPPWTTYPVVLIPNWTAGIYATTNGFRAVGIVDCAALNNELGGQITLAVTRSGAASGVLSLGAANGATSVYRFTGTFDAEGKLITSIPRRGAASLQLTLALDMIAAPTTFTLTAASQVTDGVSIAGVSGTSIPWSTTNPAVDYAGQYNVGLVTAAADLNKTVGGVPEVSQGFGFFTMGVASRTGAAQIAGVLSDGTRFTASNAVLSDGTVPLWVQLYSRFGMLLGDLSIDSSTTGNPVSAALYWTKPANVPRSPDSAGFDKVQLSAEAGSGIYDMTKIVPGNLTLSFDTGIWPIPPGITPFTQTFTVVNGRIIPVSPITNNVRASWNLRTGLLQGNFTSLDAFGGTRLANFQAIVLTQSGIVIRGNCILPNIAKNPTFLIGGSVKN